jgi:hypothetical protein
LVTVLKCNGRPILRTGAGGYSGSVMVKRLSLLAAALLGGAACSFAKTVAQMSGTVFTAAPSSYSPASVSLPVQMALVAGMAGLFWLLQRKRDASQAKTE